MFTASRQTKAITSHMKVEVFAFLVFGILMCHGWNTHRQLWVFKVWGVYGKLLVLPEEVVNGTNISKSNSVFNKHEIMLHEVQSELSTVQGL